MTVKQWFAAMVITAFISIISFFQINSYWADKHHFNTGWLVIGIIFALLAIFCLKRVADGGSTPKDSGL